MPTAVAAPPRGPKPMTEDRKGRIEQTLLYVIVIVPFLALAGAVAVAWGWGISWLDVTLAVVFYLVAGLGGRRVGAACGRRRASGGGGGRGGWPLGRGRAAAGREAGDRAP